MSDPQPHPAHIDEADRPGQRRNPVPWIVAILVVAAVIALLAFLDMHGIERQAAR